MLPIEQFWSWIDAHKPSNGEVYTLSNTAIAELEKVADRLDREITSLRNMTVEQLQELIDQEEKHQKEVAQLKERLHGACSCQSHNCEKRLENETENHQKTCRMKYEPELMAWHCLGCGRVRMGLKSEVPRYCPACGAKATVE